MHGSPADFLARWHYAGLFAAVLVEESGVPLPVPGDLFILAMGFLAQRGGAAWAPTAAVATAAAGLGSTVLYLVARHAGRPLLVRVARRLGFTEARERRLEALLSRRGAAGIVLLRLVPGLRVLTTVLAGVLRVPHPTFALGVLVAAATWSTAFFWIGFGAGAGAERLSGRVALGELWPWAAGAALAIAALVAWRWRRRVRAAAAAPVEPGP